MTSYRELDRRRFEELSALAGALTEAERQRDDWRAMRNDAIRAAVDEGLSQAEVARLCGLSRTTVSQIVRKR